MNWINAKNNPPESSDLYMCVIKDRRVVGGYYKDTLYWSEHTRLWEDEEEYSSSVLYYISLTDIPLPAELTGCSC